MDAILFLVIHKQMIHLETAPNEVYLKGFETILYLFGYKKAPLRKEGTNQN